MAELRRVVGVTGDSMARVQAVLHSPARRQRPQVQAGERTWCALADSFERLMHGHRGGRLRDGAVHRTVVAGLRRVVGVTGESMARVQAVLHSPARRQRPQVQAGERTRCALADSFQVDGAWSPRGATA